MQLHLIMSGLIASANTFITRKSQTHTQTVIYTFKQPVRFVDIIYFSQGLFEINP